MYVLLNAAREACKVSSSVQRLLGITNPVCSIFVQDVVGADLEKQRHCCVLSLSGADFLTNTRCSFFGYHVETNDFLFSLRYWYQKSTKCVVHIFAGFDLAIQTSVYVFGFVSGDNIENHPTVTAVFFPPPGLIPKPTNVVLIYLRRSGYPRRVASVERYTAAVKLLFDPDNAQVDLLSLEIKVNPPHHY